MSPFPFVVCQEESVIDVGVTLSEPALIHSVLLMDFEVAQMSGKQLVAISIFLATTHFLFPSR